LANVVVYSSPSCAFCTLAKRFLQERNVEYTEHNVAQDPARAAEMFEKSGQSGIPVLDIDGKIIVGFDRPAIKKALGLGS